MQRKRKQWNREAYTKPQKCQDRKAQRQTCRLGGIRGFAEAVAHREGDRDCRERSAPYTGERRALWWKHSGVHACTHGLSQSKGIREHVHACAHMCGAHNQGDLQLFWRTDGQIFEKSRIKTQAGKTVGLNDFLDENCRIKITYTQFFTEYLVSRSD